MPARSPASHPLAGDGGKAPTDLDVCGGHVDKTHRFYHYHVQPSLKSPYTSAAGGRAGPGSMGRCSAVGHCRLHAARGRWCCNAQGCAALRRPLCPMPAAAAAPASFPCSHLPARLRFQ